MLSLQDKLNYVMKYNHDTRLSYGYYETVCDACGRKFSKRVDSINYVEKYMEFFCCLFCGYPNNKRKVIMEHPGIGNITFVPQFSCGYEIEFFIPDSKNDNLYILGVKDWKHDTWGWDGLSPAVKEYRSPVFLSYDKPKCIEDTITSLYNIKSEILFRGGVLQPTKLTRKGLLVAGIHLSFGEDFLKKEISESIKKIVYKYRKSGVLRNILIQKERKHQERREYRVFDSSEKGLFSVIKCLTEIQEFIGDKMNEPIL